MPTKEQITEHFYMTYGKKLDDLLYDIKKNMDDNSIPLLNAPSGTMNADFTDLILFSVKEWNIINN